MIQMLELIIFFNAFGGMTLTYTFFGFVRVNDLILLSLSILYVMLPTDQISEFFFPVVNNEEVI
jgi:hypothetical protein